MDRYSRYCHEVDRTNDRLKEKLEGVKDTDKRRQLIDFAREHVQRFDAELSVGEPMFAVWEILHKRTRIPHARELLS